MNTFCCNSLVLSCSAIRIVFLCFLICHVKGQEHREIPLTCTSNWTQYDKNCYRLYTSVKDWIDAYRYCQLEDSILVDIASESEQNFLQDFVNGTDVWIGASDIFINGQWLWYGSHQSWNYTNWNTKEPDNQGNVEHCIIINNQGKWSDRDCSQERAFVCKKRTFLSFCDSSWAVKDGHCYKHFTSQLTWNNAMKDCQANTAVLVSIKNSAEHSFVNGLYNRADFWIGGFDRHREGTWAWSGTTMLWSSTFWLRYQPNNSKNQDCLTAYIGSGLWNDLGCNEKRTYMCQRNTFHLDKDPVLTFEVNETTQETSLLCDFDTNFTDIEFLVNWYYNSDMIKEEKVTISKTESLLEETHIPLLLFRDQIKCTVTPCMPGNCSGFRGSLRNSNIIIAKVQVESGTQITVHERSGPATINVTSTIPPRLFCYKELRANACKVEITTELVKGREFKCRGFPVSQAVFGIDNLHTKPCSHMINKDNWQSGVLISVKASIDSLRDRDQRRNIRLSLKTPNETREISTVQVTVIDGDKVALCSSINDPHMTTFDKKYYDVYLEGEFILYRHRTLPYEVRTFYRRCNRVAACNCAVAIRSGDDVILFDVCGPSMGKSSRRTRYTMKMYLNGDLTPGTDVIRKGGGKTYEVILPTGAVIYVITGKLLRGSRFFNVKMLASTLDYNNTEGLCGSFDGDRNNDFRKRDGELYTRGGKQPNEFSLSWRVPEEDSLYRGYCESSADTSPKVENYCDCLAGKTAACQEGMDKMTCVEIQKRKGLLGNRRTKLVTLDLIKDAESPPARCQSIRPPEPFGYVPNYTQPDPVWPTPGNITEDEARKFCQGFIEAKESGKKCASLPGLDLTPIVQGCITDLQLTDDKSWASESFDNLQQECTTIVEGDPDQWTVNNETGDSIPPPEIVGVICPNSCTENGNCTDGLCQCFHPWIGDDCSINSTAPPDLFEIGNGEPCDSICTNCTTVNLYGDNFADVENLTCHYRSLGINMQAVSASTSKAEFLNSQTVKCAFLNDGLYEVAVSNDGQTTSLYTIYIIYNSHCHQCTSSGCTVRTDVCRIGGVCFVHGFVNPQNVLDVCDISVSNNGWSTLQVEKISTKRYNFQNIIGQYLVTSSDNVVIGGTGTPTLTTGVSGGTAVILDGRQYLAFGDLTNVCFGDIAKSSLGITITFNVRLMTNTHTCFLLSNGGDDDQYYGYAIWFGNNRLYARVSNKWSEWVTSMSSVKLEEFMTVEMSWSLQFGLQLSVDQEVKASTRKCISRLTSNYTVFKDFIVGGSSKKEQNCQMMIETITFVCAGKDIINSTGLKFKDPEVPGQCVVSLRLEATAAVISTSVIAGTLFCITCIFCILCGCRRRKKKKRFARLISQKSSTDFQEGSSKKTRFPVFWEQYGGSTHTSAPRWHAYCYQADGQSQKVKSKTTKEQTTKMERSQKERGSNPVIIQPELLLHKTSRVRQDDQVIHSTNQTQSHVKSSDNGVMGIKGYHETKTECKTPNRKSNMIVGENEQSVVSNWLQTNTSWTSTGDFENDAAVYRSSDENTKPYNLRLITKQSSENDEKISRPSVETTRLIETGKFHQSTSTAETINESMIAHRSKENRKICPYCTCCMGHTKVEHSMLNYMSENIKKAVDSSCQTDFLSSASALQGNAMYSKDDGINKQSMNQGGYENIESHHHYTRSAYPSVASFQSSRREQYVTNINQAGNKRKSSDVNLHRETKENTICSLSVDGAGQKIEGKHTGMEYLAQENTRATIEKGEEVQEKSVLIQFDSDDEGSMSSGLPEQTLHGMEKVMIKTEVKPRRKEKEFYEIRTEWVPFEKNQKEAILTKEEISTGREGRWGYLYDGEVRRVLMNHTQSESEVVLPGPRPNMERYVTNEEADTSNEKWRAGANSNNNETEAYKLRKVWIPKESKHETAVTKEEIKSGIGHESWYIYGDEMKNEPIKSQISQSSIVPQRTNTRVESYIEMNKKGSLKRNSNEESKMKPELLQDVRYHERKDLIEQQTSERTHHRIHKERGLSPTLNDSQLAEEVIEGSIDLKDGGLKSHEDGYQRSVRTQEILTYHSASEPKTVVKSQFHKKLGEKERGFTYVGQVESGHLHMDSTKKENSVFVSVGGNEMENSFDVEGTTFYKPGGTVYRYQEDGTKEYLTKQESTIPFTFSPKTVDKNSRQSEVGEKRLVHLRQNGSEILEVPHGNDGDSGFNPENGNKIEGTTFYKSTGTAYRYKDDGRKEYVTMPDSAYPVTYHQETEILESDQSKEKVPFYHDRPPEDLTSGRIYRKQPEWRAERTFQDDAQPRVYRKWKVIEKTEA